MAANIVAEITHARIAKIIHSNWITPSADILNKINPSGRFSLVQNFSCGTKRQSFLFPYKMQAKLQAVKFGCSSSILPKTVPSYSLKIYCIRSPWHWECHSLPATILPLHNKVLKMSRIISNGITNLLPEPSKDSACYLVTVQFNVTAGSTLSPWEQMKTTWKRETHLKPHSQVPGVWKR